MNLVLTGHVQPQDPECFVSDHVTLERAIDSEGEDLNQWHNGNPMFFTREDIAEMEAALLYRGEFVSSRAKPSLETLAFVRNATINQ